MNIATVSIIIPVYNASKYIIETLESVIRQTFDNWELILVDDGSTDASVEVIKRFISSFDEKAVLLAHPEGENRGTSATRNLGLLHASGEYVCFLDADDVWHPEFLAYFVDRFKTNPQLVMAYSPWIYWYSEDNEATYRYANVVQNRRVGKRTTIDSLTLFKLFLENDNAAPSPSGMMTRKSVVIKVGGWEECFRGMCDDLALYAKILLQGGDVHVAAQPLYRYRQHNESLCHVAVKKDRHYYAIKKKYFTWLHEYLGQGPFSGRAVQKILKEQMALLEIKHQIDNHLKTSGSRFRAIVKFISILIHLRHIEGVCYSYKVIRYGAGYFVARLLGLDREN